MKSVKPTMFLIWVASKRVSIRGRWVVGHLTSSPSVVIDGSANVVYTSIPFYTYLKMWLKQP